MLLSRPMRHFSSYGPVEPKAHFAVPRSELVDECVTRLVGRPDESGGHYFTIWGPRQTGKTWIMREAIQAIRERYGDRFVVGALSMQGRLETNDGEDVFFRCVPGIDNAPTTNRSPYRSRMAWMASRMIHVLPVWRGPQIVK
jgi:hypothetical protein